jgi:hypothetical protein
MNLPIPQVIIGFDKMVMKTLFQKGTRYEDLIENITTSGALMFDSRSNPNFIDFEHSFGGEEKGNIMKITLIDPKNEFEKIFMLGTSTDTVENYLAHKAQKGDLRTASRGGDHIGTSHTPTAQSARADKVAEQERDISDFELRFAKKLADSIGSNQTVYISYGVGPNLDSWAGPHTMKLYGAELAVDGFRQITLLFQATDLSFSTEGRRDIYQQSVNLDLEGLGIEIDAESRNFNFSMRTGSEDRIYPPWKDDFRTAPGKNNTYQNLFTADTIMHDESSYQQYFRDVGLPMVGVITQRIDLHVLITDVIRDLIRKATGNQNVIVLLANLNYTQGYAIQQFLIEQGITSFEYKGKSVGGDPPTADSQLLSLDRTFYGRNSLLGKLFYFLQDILSGYGINLRISKGDGSVVEATFKSLEALQYGKKVVAPPGMTLKQIEALRRVYPITPPKLTKFQDTLDNFIKDNSFTAGLVRRSNKGLPDYWDILKKITNRLKKGSEGLYGPVLDLFYESDLNLLELWSSDKYKDYPLFGGFDRTFNSDEGAIIFGDSYLIRDYLYGAMSLKKLEYTKKSTIQTYQNEINAIKGLGEEMYLGHGPRDYAPLEKFKQLSFKQKVVGLDLVPLHPVDRAFLLNKKYNEEVRVITYPPHSITGPYGNISYIPSDDFEHVENFNEEDRQEIENLGIPIFRYNTQNPNVTELKLAKSDIYFKNLNMGFQRDVARRASSTVRGILKNEYVSFNFLEWGDVIGFIAHHERALGNDPKKQEKILKQMENKFKAFDLGLFEGTTPREQAESAWEAYKATLKKQDHPMIIIDQLLPGDPITAMAEFTEAMYRNQFQVSISTLPSFHFGTGQMLLSPCMLLAQDAPIIQSDKPPSTLLNSFMSGWYTIVDFKHIINSRGASSEFTLIKIPTSLESPKFTKKKE